MADFSLNNLTQTLFIPLVNEFGMCIPSIYADNTVFLNSKYLDIIQMYQKYIYQYTSTRNALRYVFLSCLYINYWTPQVKVAVATENNFLIRA